MPRPEEPSREKAAREPRKKRTRAPKPAAEPSNAARTLDSDFGVAMLVCCNDDSPGKP